MIAVRYLVLVSFQGATVGSSGRDLRQAIAVSHGQRAATSAGLPPPLLELGFHLFGRVRVGPGVVQKFQKLVCYTQLVVQASRV